MASQLVYAATTKEFSEILESLALCSACIAAMFRTVNFLFKVKKISKLVESLNQLLEFSYHPLTGNRDQLREQIKFAHNIYIGSWVSAFVTCSIAAFVPFLSHKIPYKAWFPFDTETSEIGFWAASAYVVLNTYVVSSIDITVNMFPVVLMSFTVGLTNELGDRLAGCQSNEELVQCVKVHQRIKKFHVKVLESFSTVTFLQALLSSFMICTSVFTMSIVSFFKLSQKTGLSLFLCFQEKDPSKFMRIFSFAIPITLLIFFPCYIGNELMVASSKLPASLLHSKWFDEDRKMGKNVIIFMENVKNVIKFSAFGVFNANLETFGSIGHTAYSLFAVLKNVNN